jgi:Domain of unknown function (DUF5666)
MIAAATNRASAAGRRWAPALAGLGVVVLSVAACGGNGATAAPAAPAATVASPAAPGSSPTPTAGQAAFPGVVGTAAAVSGSNLEVQNPTSGQVTVTFTATTPITDTVAVTSKDVTVGSCVTVVGKPSAAGAAAKSVTATSVTISAPVNGACTGAGGFGGFGGGGFGGGGFGRGGGGAGATPRPSFSPRPRPSGSRGAFGNGAFGGANGKVTSVSASGFVVQGRNRAAGSTGSASASTTSMTVTATAATKYLKTITAAPSALKVGQCITALGTANSIGAIAARSIRISQPGPTGCVTGFGGRGGFGRPTTNA